jgi:hypothetical protein
MTTYNNTEFTTAEDLRNAINSDLEALAYPFAVKHRTYGEGQLTFVKAPLTGGSLYATIDFAAGTKTISLDMVFANNLLEMPEILLDTLLELQTTFKADFIEREQAQRLAARQAREEAEAAKKKAAEDKKNEEKYEATKAKMLKDFEAITSADRPVEVANEFYYSLGWLAKHIGTVTARLPDYLEPSFTKYFGDVPRYVFDSKKKSPSGWTYQWAMALSATIKKAGTIPATLEAYLNPTRKALSDTGFVWDLVDNYGFQFGKKQDIDKIRSHVPSDCIASFEAGLA